MDSTAARRAIIVFAVSSKTALSAVEYIHNGAPGVPIWLYSPVEPTFETMAMCERVCVLPNGRRLFIEAGRHLWRTWAALAVGTWTGEPGSHAFKLAPLLLPPFRSLFLNENGDFFSGSPTNLWSHSRWRLGTARERVRNASLYGLAWMRALARAYVRKAKIQIQEYAHEVRIRISDLVYAYFVFTVSHILRIFRHPHRTLFCHLHGKEALQLPALETVPAGGVARFHQRGSAWDGFELEALLLQGQERWLLWHQAPDFEVTDEMLAMFDNQKTFAISVQTHYSEWKPALVPMAPFRTLQRGTASRVLAPLSTATLVDRQKLMALGIPRCELAATAWLILFWKAAAAGWASYCIGLGEPARKQPDFPAAEAEFLLHLLWNRNLRRLAPCEPDLARGTIAFAPSAHCRAQHPDARLRVLLVSPFLPYPLSHGGAVRIYNLCRELSSKVCFVLVAIREKDDVVRHRELEDVFRRVFVVDMDEPPSRDQGLPFQVRCHHSRSVRALVASLAEQWNPDLLQIEYTHIAAFRDCAPRVPAILVEHDLTFTLYRQLAEKIQRAENWLEFQRWHRFERDWLRRYDSVWTVSEQDQELALNEGSSKAHTVVVPNGVDTGRYTLCDQPSEMPEILYVGSFRHLPNVLGFETLQQEVMPTVWSRHPEVRLSVVGGPRHTDYWKGGSHLDTRIVVHGFIEDLRPFYAAASVVVVPLAISAGTNIKVLEAMACGKALVTTPAGCAGLGLVHGGDALIHAEWRMFADAICNLLDNPPLRRRLGLRARRTAEDRFSWTAIADRAYASYEQLIAANMANRPALECG